MSLHKAILITSLTLLLSGCSQTEIGEFTPDATSPTNINPPDSQIENSPVNYTDTTNWSKFSFSNFSLFLPKDFQVNGMNNDQTEISFANFALTPGKSYQPKLDKNHFILKVVITKPGSDILNSNLKIKDMSANKTIEEGQTIVNVNNDEQDTNYQFVFDFDFTASPDLIDRIIKTLDFHKRNTLK